MNNHNVQVGVNNSLEPIYHDELSSTNNKETNKKQTKTVPQAKLPHFNQIAQRSSRNKNNSSVKYQTSHVEQHNTTHHVKHDNTQKNLSRESPNNFNRNNKIANAKTIANICGDRPSSDSHKTKKNEVGKQGFQNWINNKFGKSSRKGNLLKNKSEKLGYDYQKIKKWVNNNTTGKVEQKLFNPYERLEILQAAAEYAGGPSMKESKKFIDSLAKMQKNLSKDTDLFTKLVNKFLENKEGLKGFSKSIDSMEIPKPFEKQAIKALANKAYQRNYRGRLSNMINGQLFLVKEMSNSWAAGREFKNYLFGNFRDINYEGFYSEESEKYVAGELRNFIHNESNDLGEQTQCLSNLLKSLDNGLDNSGSKYLNQTVDAIRDGKPVIINTGWKQHSTAIVIYGDKLVKLNRGGGKDGEFGAVVYEWDTKISDKDLKKYIGKLTSEKSKSVSEKNSYFKNIDHDMKLKKRDDLSLKMSNQVFGNCTVAGKKAAVYATLFLDKLNNESNIETAKDEAKKIYKSFTSHLRMNTLKRALDLWKTNIHQADWVLLSSIYEKLQNKKQPMTTEQKRNFDEAKKIFSEFTELAEKHENKINPTRLIYFYIATNNTEGIKRIIDKVDFHSKTYGPSPLDFMAILERNDLLDQFGFTREDFQAIDSGLKKIKLPESMTKDDIKYFCKYCIKQYKSSKNNLKTFENFFLTPKCEDYKINKQTKNKVLKLFKQYGQVRAKYSLKSIQNGKIYQIWNSIKYFFKTKDEEYHVKTEILYMLKGTPGELDSLIKSYEERHTLSTDLKKALLKAYKVQFPNVDIEIDDEQLKNYKKDFITWVEANTFPEGQKLWGEEKCVAITVLIDRLEDPEYFYRELLEQIERYSNNFSYDGNNETHVKNTALLIEKSNEIALNNGWYEAS